MELFTLSNALNSIDEFKSFSINSICILAEKFYRQNFTENDLQDLRKQLDHYKYGIVDHPQFQNIASRSQLCQLLVETKTSTHYFLIDRLIHCVLILLVSNNNNRMSFFSDKTYKNIYSQ